MLKCGSGRGGSKKVSEGNYTPRARAKFGAISSLPFFVSLFFFPRRLVCDDGDNGEERGGGPNDVDAVYSLTLCSHNLLWAPH